MRTKSTATKAARTASRPDPFRTCLTPGCTRPKMNAPLRSDWCAPCDSALEAALDPRETHQVLVVADAAGRPR